MKNKKNRITFSKIVWHFFTILRHKFYILVECWKVGLFWQGLTHDLSKFSPIEFWSGAKYYQGNKSPIDEEIKHTGYSRAWEHHKRTNKHHFEYWGQQRMPDKYVLELACDMIAAGKTYCKKFDRGQPYDYFCEHKKFELMNPYTRVKLRRLLINYAIYGRFYE